METAQTKNQTAITKEQVKEVIARITKETGSQPSLREIRKALGGGSMTTISRFVNEIQAETRMTADAPAVRKVLEGLWEQALELCRKELEERYKLMHQNNEELLLEIDRKDRALDESARKLELAEKQIEELRKQNETRLDELAYTRKQLDDKLVEVTNVREELMKEIKTLRDKVGDLGRYAESVKLESSRYRIECEEHSKQETDKYRTQVEALSKEINQRTIDQATKDGQIALLQEKLANEQDRNRQAQQMLESAQRQISDASARIATMSDDSMARERQWSDKFQGIMAEFLALRESQVKATTPIPTPKEEVAKEAHQTGS